MAGKTNASRKKITPGLFLMASTKLSATCMIITNRKDRATYPNIKKKGEIGANTIERPGFPVTMYIATPEIRAAIRYPVLEKTLWVILVLVFVNTVVSYSIKIIAINQIGIYHRLNWHSTLFKLGVQARTITRNVNYLRV